MNPYEVLGVSPASTQEEIRSAYLKLVKKYHPDRYQDSALKQQAEEKMKKINSAYDMLTKNPQKSNTTYGGSTYDGGSAYGSSYRGQYAEEFMKVRAFINAGSIEAAAALLDAIPLHNAEWYFLYGMCYYRNGQYGNAYDSVSRACSMDPNNFEYRSALAAMRGGPRTRQGVGDEGVHNRFCGICSTLLCANLCCGCFGRGYWC